jgi:hypothetical protein
VLMCILQLRYNIFKTQGHGKDDAKLVKRLHLHHHHHQVHVATTTK